MGKLYPPIIEGTLPAFYSENGMVKITIPFSMNRAVNTVEIGGFELRIKTVQNGLYLHTVRTYNPAHYKIEENSETYVTFWLDDSENKLKIGQFYKFQLAYLYVDQEEKVKKLNAYYQGLITLDIFEKHMSNISTVGFYSDAGVAKYTSKPNIYISDLRKGFINAYTHNYTGCYDQSAPGSDTTEKVYSYRFDVFDQNYQLCWSTGDLLHNNSLDTNNNFSQDNYQLNRDIEEETIYYIQYTVTTANKLTLSTPKYKLIHRELISAQLSAELTATLNFDNGYIDITANSDLDAVGLPTLITGAFILLRSDENSNFIDWKEVHRFKLNNEALKRNELLFRDFTIEQGKKYQYAIQQYNDNNLYSSKIYSNYIVGDFEDAFLYDGNRQLKIKYNPKIAKFTNTRLEQKIDTIGGKFPFIFRNGQVNYNEFSIGGLISYFMDEDKFFLSEEDFVVVEKTTNYTTDNLIQERVFKMTVLEWLNNGEPKLFRSPEEGNYIIRILKLSLSPENKLGRLLHNFSGTAYEIADYTIDNLYKYNFLKRYQDIDTVLNWATIDLQQYQPNAIFNTLSTTVKTIHFQEMIPGERILITFKDNSQEIVVIGKTGNYYLNSDVIISSVTIPPRYEPVKIPNYSEYINREYYIYDTEREKYIEATSDKQGEWNVEVFPTMRGTSEFRQLQYYRLINKTLHGLLTYSYEMPIMSTFENINNVTIQDCTIQQFIGQHDILKEITCVEVSNNNYVVNPKVEIINYYNLNVSVRPVEKFEKITDGILYYGSLVEATKKHPFTLYYCTDEKNFVKPYVDYVIDHFSSATVGKAIDYTDYEPYIIINGETIYITHDTEINLKEFGEINELKSGNGVVVNLIYQTRVTEFNVELNDEELLTLNKAYSDAVAYLDSWIEENFTPGSTDDPSKTEQLLSQLKFLRRQIKDAHLAYMVKLISKL